MATEPALTPVTTPADETVAIAVEELTQDPPDTLLVRVMVAPAQTDVGPEMAPIVGAGLTLMECVAIAVPQVPVTV